MALNTLQQRTFLSPTTPGAELSPAEEKVTYVSSTSQRAAEEDLTAQLCTKQNPCNILVAKPETATQLIPTYLLLALGNATTICLAGLSVKLFQAKPQPNALENKIIKKIIWLNPCISSPDAFAGRPASSC